ncbi:MAG: hypothetical protein QXU81_00880 [Candidatus Bathyarchaeia archaeon]
MENNPRSKWVDVIKDEMDKIMGALHTTYIDVLNLNLPEVGYTREDSVYSWIFFREAREE